MPHLFSRFWHEIKRRKVIRVLAWYAGVGFVVIELAINVTEPLNLPAWIPRLVIFLVVLGFPVTAILSWIFDITPDGISRISAPEDRQADVSEFGGSIAVLPFQDMSPKKDLDKAFSWFDKACKERDLNLPMYMLIPVEAYRIPDEPLFQDLLQKNGLHRFALHNHVKTT